MNRSIIAVSLLLILANSPVSAQHSAGWSATAASLNYERSGPTAEAARYAVKSTPDIGAAHALSLARELPTQCTAEELATLTKYGPWLTKIGISDNAQQLIRAIQDAQVHGLNPQAYGQNDILTTLDTLTHLDTTRTVSNDPLAAFDPRDDILRDKFSQLLDDAFGELIMHHGQGLVDARATQNRLFRDVPDVHLGKYRQALSNGQLSVEDVLLLVQPNHGDYRRLTQHMRDLLTEYASSVERPSINVKEDLSATQIHDDVLSIKRRLIEDGELPFNTLLTPIVDAELVVALKAFQQRNGLEVSGDINLKTRKALNTSIEDEITAVSLSLERWRWMPRDLGDKHLFVNIPDYRVVMKEGEETTLSMTTVVGSTKHQTPAFTREMSYMEFNPTWTVPTSIANRELIPKERRKPGYLASREFDYLERVNNRLVKIPASQVTNDDFEKKPFPYVLQQRGGPINALGRMKFMMPNPYAIYLHDTQIKQHFTLNDRAFSHGCIRLSEPDLLAQQLLEGDGYSSSEIERALSTKKTKQVRLRSPVPTHLTYITTWVDENGTLQQRPDIYNHDPALTTALRASNSTLLSMISKPASKAITTTFAYNAKDS